MQESINKKSMLKVGTILHDTYRIDSYLSSGGFGNTYVATNIAFDERVAIKEFFMKGVTERDGNHTTVSVSNSENTNSFLEQKEKFKKEARRLRRLKNEHIVKVHDLFDENGTAYYVMDYMDGENLSERLKRIGRPMTEFEVNILLPQILDALKAVHNEGFCHLDIKPSNIMLEKGNKVKLIDFGASKQLGAKGTLTSNESTAFAKTPGFAPREQIEQNLDKIGPWTDIYALGATLYCLLTTKYPPMPSDIDDDMSQDKHLSLPMPETAGGLKNLVLQMMKTNRLQRPQSIDAIISAVKSRDKGFEQIPVQQEPLQDGKTYEDEGTIVEEPRSKKETKKVNIPPQIPDSPVKEEEPPSSKGISPYIWIVGIVFVVIILVFSYREYSHKIGLGSPVDKLSVDTVDTDTVISNQAADKVSVSIVGQYTPIGTCSYTGEVDKNQVPHGYGEARFDDGRYYKGYFVHGNLHGKDAYFKYDNGDTFKGEFRNNSFYNGTYTIAEDGSYFVGSYKNGQPNVGSWYDKNGKIIEK